MRILIFSLFLSLSFLNYSCGDQPNDSKKSKTSKSAPVSYDRKTNQPVESNDSDSEKVEERTVPPEQLAKAKAIIAAATADQIAEVDAKGKYKMFCAACHGFDGSLGVNGAKDLSVSTLDLTEAVAQVYFGKGLMTPFKGLLKDHEIVAVSKYVQEELSK